MGYALGGLVAVIASSTSVSLRPGLALVAASAFTLPRSTTILDNSNSVWCQVFLSVRRIAKYKSKEHEAATTANCPAANGSITASATAEAARATEAAPTVKHLHLRTILSRTCTPSRTAWQGCSKKACSCRLNFPLGVATR
jgi:hypothetical protein